ncbi:MAG: GDP-mannose 4,6-dehydratase [bacterium]|nr:GDP-mannose 4,6-dehydratase [bacterium]MDZ4346714.1 GDP-mannose 4,6-dehydratase [Candidatus Binatia bacterium]
MKKFLITGGAGFIGSHLAEYLLAKGAGVRVVDNLSTGSADNMRSFSGNPSFEFTIGDVVDKELMTKEMSGVDGVFHLAASVGVKHIMENLVASIRNNVLGTEVVLETASDLGVRILLTSTSEVYGKISDQPSAESDDFRMGEPLKSRWSYACSKALDEYMAFAYYHERNLPVTVTRLFNTVGPRQTSAYGMVIPTFVKQAVAGEPITIHGDGKQSRCFVYVKDVVWALYNLMFSDAAVGEIYNIGSTEKITIDELADRIIKITGSASIKKYFPYDHVYKVGFDDAYSRQPKIDKVQQAIGFMPRHKLDDIIKLVLENIAKPEKAVVSN